MKHIRFLDWPLKRYYGETHVFHRWKKLLREQGLQVTLHYDHRDRALLDADCLIIHSRYFGAWQNTATRNTRNQDELLAFLARCRARVNRLIWFDAADSTGSADLMLLPHVDLFLKKQLLKDKSYYLGGHGKPNLRIWLPENEANTAGFTTAAAAELGKMRLAWNLGLNDYRYFGYKMSRLSNYLDYRLYPLRFRDVNQERPLDIVFRGTLHQDLTTQHAVSGQRNHVLQLLKGLKRNIPGGEITGKRAYWRELKMARVGISPFGWGEICYRDFEILISGCLLIKPDMNHLETYPDVFVDRETYLAVRWDLADLENQLNTVMDDFDAYSAIATYGQELYKKACMDGQAFVKHFKQTIC